MDGPVGLAMRRLSIIDLEGGDQPIANEDGTVHVVCNGEIYNYRELRAELAARGHRLRTRSRHRGARPPLRGARARRSSSGCAACSPSRSGTRRRRGSCSRATASASSRCTTRSDGGRAGLRLRAARRCSRARLLAEIDLARRRVLPRLQLRAGPADGLPRRAQAAGRAPAGRGRAPSRASSATRAPAADASAPRARGRRPTGSPRSCASACATRCARISWPTCRWGCCCRAASTRARWPRWPPQESGERAEHLLHRLRRARLVRAGAGPPGRASATGPITTSSSCARTPSSCCRGWRETLRRAVRRLVGAADLPRLPARGRARQGRASRARGATSSSAATTPTRRICSRRGSAPGERGAPAGRAAAQHGVAARGRPAQALRARGRTCRRSSATSRWSEVFSEDARAELLDPAAGGRTIRSPRPAPVRRDGGAEPLAPAAGPRPGRLARRRPAREDRSREHGALRWRPGSRSWTASVAEFAFALPARHRVRGPPKKRAAAPRRRAAAARARSSPARKRGFSIPAAAWLRGELQPFAREVLAPARVRQQGFFDPRGGHARSSTPMPPDARISAGSSGACCPSACGTTAG